MADVVVLFALEREARPFRTRAPGVRVIVTGVGRERACAAAERAMADHQPTLVIVAGFCGALRATGKVGDVIVPAVITGESATVWTCAGGTGRLLTMDRMIGEPAEKAMLAERFDADAVDMESAGVAEVCRRLGVPFAAVRVVSDTATTRLSPRLRTLIVGGEVSPWRALAAIVRQPRIVGEFRRLARDTRFAANRLSEHLADQYSTSPPS